MEPANGKIAAHYEKEYSNTLEENNAAEYFQSEVSGNIMEHYSPESLGLRVLAAPDRSFTGSQNVRPPSYRIQELEYSLQKTTAWEEEQQKTRIRMETENARIKSAQEQLDKKLKEVEQQLKKTEGAAQAKEDVKSFAEQVKRQLYEELHVEKLRRGLV